jgi:hypothetical protein
VRIGDFVNLNARRENVYDDRLVQGDHARAELFSPDKLAVGRIHGEEIALHPHDCALMTFHRADEMTLRVLSEKLPMNNVNVLASINNHRFVEVAAVLSSKFHELKNFPILGAQVQFVYSLVAAATRRCADVPLLAEENLAAGCNNTTACIGSSWQNQQRIQPFRMFSQPIILASGDF